MLANHSKSQQLSNISKTDLLVPSAVIAKCLGSGLAYSEWQAVVEKQGYVWSTKLKKAIIEEEWEFFRPEIQRLRSEPRITQSTSSKSNSLVSIWKRLKGEPWLEGYPDEREERLRTRRLLGKDTKARCLQIYVRKWDKEVASSKSSLFAQSVTATPPMRTIPGNSALGFASNNHCVPEVQSISDSFEPVSSFPLGNVGPSADAPPSMFDCPPKLGSSLAPFSTQTGTYSSTTSDFDALRSPPFLNHDETASAFGHYPISEDDVPTTTNHNLSFHTPEPEHDVFDWMETHPVSETSESLEPAAFGPETGFQGTFLDHRNSIDLSVPDVRDCLNRSSAKDMPRNFSGQQNVHPGILAVSSHSLSSPQSSSKGRKRRRRSTPELTPDMWSYGHGATPTSSDITADADIVMSGNERNPQHPNTPVSQRSWSQLGPSSKPLLIPPNSGMTPKTTYEIRAQIELESELQRNELAFVKKQYQAEIAFLRKQHQKEMESSIRIRNAMEAEISELQQQVRELQISTEQYEELARSAINDKIILQESISRKKSISERPPTSSEERGHSTKQAQFPSSKNPRPLSLTLRPATAHKASPSPPRRPSPSNLDNPSSLRPPNTTHSSSRPVTPDNSQVFPGHPVTSNESPKSTGQRYRPSSSDSNQRSSARHVPISSPPKSAGQINMSGTTDPTTAPNSSTSSRRGFLQSMHKLSNQFLRKQYRDDSTKTAPTVPVLPPFEASVPLNRQMAGILVDGDKRLTNDSGYDSLRSEASSGPSTADI